MEKNPSSHPYLKCNLIQRIFHSWVWNILKLGQKRQINIDDIYEILPNEKSQPWIDRLENAWKDEIGHAVKKPSLFRVTMKIYGLRLVKVGILLLIHTIFRFAQPFFLGRLIEYFDPCSSMPLVQGLLFGFLVAFLPWLMFISRHMAFAYSMLDAMTMRFTYTGFVYRKLIKLSMGSLGKHSSGKIINLLTNDVGTVENFMINVHFIWVTIIEFAVIVIFLWSYVGPTILLSVLYTGLVLILQIVLGKLIQLIWSHRVKKTDERIKLMNEIVRSIHLVKMYVWEQPFRLKVERIRRRETYFIILQSVFNTLKLVIGQMFQLVFFLILFGFMWLKNIPFDTKFFTTVFVLVNFLRHTLVHNFSYVWMNAWKYFASCQRIQKFLLSDEHHKLNHELDDPQLKIAIENLSSTWSTNSSSFSLQNIHFSAKSTDLVIIVGSIASGKSSLLLSILNEMDITHGKISIDRDSKICYVPQEPWIFSGTMKENILFGLDYDQVKFQQCIEAAALEFDMRLLPYGDSTLVGDNGVILSGGQKARVSLARALYRDADIYLLDDPLSAVDGHVSRHIFEKCILGRLKSKVCILVTHQIQFLKYATKIILLDKGKQIAIGSFEELSTNSNEFKEWTKVPREFDRAKSITSSRSRSSTLANSIKGEENDDENEFKTEDQALMNDTSNKPVEEQTAETRKSGKVSWKVYKSYISSATFGFFGLTVLLLLFGTASCSILFSNWWLSRWSNAEEIHNSFNHNQTACGKNKESKFSSMSETEWSNQRNRFFFILLGLSVVNFVLFSLRTMLYFIWTHSSARSLHNQMFESLLRAPILFFNSNPIGRVINRFSKDILSIDENLSDSTYNLNDLIFNIGSTIVFIAYMQPLSLIPMIISVFLLMKIRKIYSPAGSDVKRLESLNHSPIYSHLTASIHGIPIIRSYSAEQMCIHQFSHFLDEHTRVFSTALGLNRWAAMRIESTVAFFIGFLTISVFIIHRNIEISDIGLILAYSITMLGTVQWIIRLSVDVSLQMTSAERVLEYVELKPEENPEKNSLISLPKNWPIGGIVFDQLSFRYSSTGPWVLKNLQFSIKPNEKIGIVGRTGAGKSSIIQALFRMAENQGRLLIDGIDSKGLSLFDLRRKISIIPQDPVLFNDTLRINLDPFGEYSDIEIWQALEEVQLKSQLLQGLQQKVTEGGSNFSVGQRQLICLARALLRKNKILVIDEATANVDHLTDRLIQISIRRKFVNCTVLTIAHRLRTVIDSDKILLLSEGEAVEFGSPSDLLSNEKSLFSQLVLQSGDQEAKYLIELAKIRSANL